MLLSFGSLLLNYIINLMVQVDSLQALKEEHAARGLATTLYVFTLVPLVNGAPHFPLYALTHDNSNATFSVQHVLKEWQRLWEVNIESSSELCSMSSCGVLLKVNAALRCNAACQPEGTHQSGARDALTGCTRQ